MLGMEIITLAHITELKAKKLVLAIQYIFYLLKKMRKKGYRFYLG
jgi:hypothetical protein